MSDEITVTLSRDNAMLLRDVLLDRPHTEEWSNEVLDAVENALRPHLSLVGEDDD